MNKNDIQLITTMILKEETNKDLEHTNEMLGNVLSFFYQDLNDIKDELSFNEYMQLSTISN